jgi:hypothetical protein
LLSRILSKLVRLKTLKGFRSPVKVVFKPKTRSSASARAAESEGLARQLQCQKWKVQA